MVDVIQADSGHAEIEPGLCAGQGHKTVYSSDSLRKIAYWINLAREVRMLIAFCRRDVGFPSIFHFVGGIWGVQRERLLQTT